MKDIIKMAREAGFTIEGTHPTHPRRIHGYDRDGDYTQELEAFAALVEAAARADEREECAKLCDEHGFYGVSPAAAIRARGTP